MSRVATAVLGLAFAAAAVAQQPIVQTVYSSGPTQSRYDMVILGDGYQAHEQGRFDQDVQTFLTALFQRPPYQAFAAYYNVHTVFRASAESGADRPDETPPVFKNTVYNASYNIGGTARCLYIQNTAQALADAALAPANEGRVLVMVNDSRYGGCASTFAVSYNGSSMTEVQIHELGHSLGSLADEYDYPNQTYTGGEPAQVNITTSPVGQKWSTWWGTEGVSAFQGAGYYVNGLYRPKSNCLMRALGQPLCPICREQIALVTNSVADTVTPLQPTTSSVTVQVPAQQTFQIAHYVPAAHNPVITWRVDGAVVPNQSGTSFVLDSTQLGLGAHTVEVAVADQTPLVRRDPGSVMVERQSWQVTITDPTAAQLRLGSFTIGQVWVPPGTVVPLTTAVVNDGPAAAGPFTLEYFAATSQQWTPQTAIYLGAETIPGLAVGQTLNRSVPVQLPWRLEPIVYYVYAVVDRANAIREVNEADNQRMGAIVGQTGPCTVKLEYRDPLLYPADAAAIALAAGGAVQPTVVARCAAPGTLYLLLWGASGTQPGTPLGPLTVPLNQDGYTQLGLLGANGSVFQQFLGPLDAQGIGQATFALPPGISLQAGLGHFAAVLVDPALGFSAVTNPVAIALQ